MFCSHVTLHVRFGKWFLADRTHTNVPLTVDLMDGKIKHRNFFLATKQIKVKDKHYCLIHSGITRKCGLSDL